MASIVLFMWGWYITTLVFSIHFESVRCDDALLFDMKNYKIVQKPSTMIDESENFSVNYASACPAFTSKDLKYNSKQSFGKKVLFLKMVYKPSENINQIEIDKCDGIVQPSVVFNTIKGSLETGYEVHDRQNIMESLSSNIEPNELLSLYPSKPRKTPKPLDVLNEYFKTKGTISQTKTNDQSIIWLSILSISFNVKIMSPVQIEYNHDLGTPRWTENCNTFDVGKEFYAENSLASFYSHENQRMLFTDAEKQSTSSTQEPECGQEYGCLVQHQIIPSYYLHSQYGALAICTPMNTVPVWEKIVERINTVDRYLYAMTQLWQTNIHIMTRFFKIFKPSGKYFKNTPFPEQALYLNQGHKNIPVPRIIYKIIQLKINVLLPHYNTDTIDYYFAIIVIHNDPTPNAETRRICDGNDALPGWKAIENETSESGLIYACRLNKHVAYKLNIPGKETMRDRPGLRIDDFPKYDEVKDTYLSYDAESEIEEKIKQLFKKEASN